MGVTITRGTVPGGYTPICNDCGISLCWDISGFDYHEDKAFWDAWKCEICNGGAPMSRKTLSHPAKPQEPQS